MNGVHDGAAWWAAMCSVRRVVVAGKLIVSSPFPPPPSTAPDPSVTSLRPLLRHVLAQQATRGRD